MLVITKWKAYLHSYSTIWYKLFVAELMQEIHAYGDVPSIFIEIESF